LTSKNPDFLKSAHIVKKEKIRSTQWNYPYDYSCWTHRSTSAINYYQYQEGTSTLDFVEPFSKNLIWHGAAKIAIDYADTPENEKN
jgi:hypothetical protein